MAARPEPSTPSAPRKRSRERGGAPGFLNVFAEPWANVVIDGRRVGTTPLRSVQLAAGSHRAFFAGDTGYYAPYFKAIGARLGPFDLAAVSIGAYEPPAIMRFTHTTPEESLRIFDDVGGRRFVAMHWGTFDLADEPLDEPPRRLRAEAQRRGLDADRVWILAHGETRAW